MSRELLQRALETLDHKFDYKLIEEIEDELAKPEPFNPDWAGYRQGVEDGKAEYAEKIVILMNAMTEISLLALAHPSAGGSCGEIARAAIVKAGGVVSGGGK